MKKVLLGLVTILVVFSSSLVFAGNYVVFDKQTGELMGTASVSDKHLLEWTQKNILIEVDNTYKGKQSYEIKYEDGKVRHATEQEVTDYKALQVQEKQAIVDAKEKAKFLKWLDDEDVKNKVKGIKNQ